MPDFLESYIPEGEARTKLKFEADSDFEEDDAKDGDGGNDAWGAPTCDNNWSASAYDGEADKAHGSPKPASESGWGATEKHEISKAAANDNWGAGGDSGW